MNARARLFASALVSAALFTAGYFVVVLVPGGGDTSAKDITDFYDSDGKIFAAFVLCGALLAGGLALLWFFNELRSALPDDILVRIGYAAAVMGAASVALGAMVFFAPGGVQQNSDGDFVGVEVAHTFAQAGLGMILLVGMTSLALAVCLYSLAMWRAAVAPVWLSIAGVIVAVVMLGSYIWIPGLIFPVWVIVVGAVSLRERAPA